MTKLDKCKLCLRESKLCNSHIIPEYAYEKVYTNGKLKPISIDGAESKHRQKGFYEKLLCEKCENKFSKWENQLKKFSSAVITGSSNVIRSQNFKIHNFPKPERIIEIKLAIISVFWRASISQLKNFAEYRLGPYDEIIRNILNSETPETTLKFNDFPIICTRMMLENEPAEIIETFGVNSIKIGGKSSYSLIFHGIRYRIVISQTKISEVPDTITLNGDPLYIVEEQILEKAIDGNAKRRLKDPDVEKFYSWASSIGKK